MSVRTGSGTRIGMWASRRRWLVQAGALVSSAAFPFRIPTAGAQSQSTLNALPRVGLVIGNTKYADAPLKNPGNDAKAIAGELQKLGFQVNLKLDAGRNEMLDAIRAYGSELAKRKSVGLFYYAGHGAQLAWRNYLIPVDAEIEKLEDMQARAVELNSLLEGLTKAQNPMNVIILDACRDNPFGNKAQAAQKGLSQVDAPLGTLLAYATSPGNVAADGEGANGLYTENLLRELTTPEARIEDVFKRVRLAVRRKSAGRQIPWESTSLEEDFYFLPPAQVKKLSEAELEKQFNEELAIWDKIKEAKEPAPLEDYLRKYSSGKFSELAQFQLDRVLAKQGEKKIEIVTDVTNPFSKGTRKADASYQIGDFYTYRTIDLLTRLVSSQGVQTVTAVTDTQVIYDDDTRGVRVQDLLGNDIKEPLGGYGREFTAQQILIGEYSVGKKWTTRFRLKRRNGSLDEVEIDLKVVGRETVTVAAGTFDAFRVEGEGFVKGAGAQWTYKYWIAPDKVRRVIAMEHINKWRGRYNITDRYELVAYRQSD